MAMKHIRPYQKYSADLIAHIKDRYAHGGYTQDNVGTPTYGADFNWTFIMVQSSNFATPVTGASPLVTISKDGAAFASLTGSPAITEIGYGLYKVTVPATDMTADVVILKATATGCAQQSAVYYLT